MAVVLMSHQKNALGSVANALNERWPVLLEGPTGCGKNVLFELLARERQKTIVRLNLNVNVTQEDIWGQNTLVKDGESSVVCFKAGPAAGAIEQGHWLLLDEVNAALPEVLFSLHALLERSTVDEVYIPILQQKVKVHPDFRVLATMNPSEEYFGARSMNQAFLNRFMMFLMHAPSIPDILKIFEGTPDEAIASTVALLLTDFSKNMGKLKVKIKVSIRDFEKLITYVRGDRGPQGVEMFVRAMYADSMRQLSSEDLSKIEILPPTSEMEEALKFFVENTEMCMKMYEMMKGAVQFPVATVKKKK